MHVRQAPCNEEVIERFLADGLGVDEQTAFETHLADCPACRQRLEELTADGRWWQEARGYLSDGDTASAPVAEPGPAALAGLQPYLTPTDDPRFLGRLGAYGVVGLVGCGGFGVVLKAFDAALNRYVAIKALSPQLATSGAARQRFAREARAAAAVVHDNIVAIYAVAEAAGLPYFVMPFISGPSLATRLRQTGPLATVEVVRIAMQIASGLAAAHALGVVHRDIKPANILLAEGIERVTITDFGLARAADDASLTKSGVITGTPQYMSPEQAGGQSVDFRSDLFSLGSVMYAMCTGRPPFRADTTLGVLRRVEDCQPRPIREINSDIPDWLARVVETLQVKEPADRFQTAAEVAALLERYLAHLTQPMTVTAPALPDWMARTETAKPKRRPPWLVWLSAAALCGTIGLTISLAGVGQSPSAEPPKEFYQDFRGGRPLQPGLGWGGLSGNEEIVPEEAGLRIKLLPTRTRTDPAGIVLTTPVRGDFEITAGYEIMGQHVPQTGSGTGVELYVMTDSSSNDATAFARVRRGNGSIAWGDIGQLFIPFRMFVLPTQPTPLPPSELYACTQMTDVNGRRQFTWRNAPAGGTAGRLRMERKGREVTLRAADALSEDFRDVVSFDLGSEEVKLVRVAAYPGQSTEPVDVRLVDLRVKGGPVTASESRLAGRARRWLTAAGGIGIVATVGLLLLAVRRRMKKGHPGHAPTERTAGNGRPPVSFACPECAATIKAPANSAGKTGKCPKCGKTVSVPAATPQSPIGASLPRRLFGMLAQKSTAFIWRTAVAAMVLVLLVGGSLSLALRRATARSLTLPNRSDVWSVTISADGTKLAAGAGWHDGLPGEVGVWDLVEQKPLQHYEETGEITSLAFTPDNKLLITASWDGNVRLRNWQTDEQISMFTMPSPTRVGMSPDGNFAAACTESGELKLIKLPSGVPFAKLEGVRDHHSVVAFSRDGKRVYAAGGDWKVGGHNRGVGWDVETKERLCAFVGHRNTILGMATSPTEPLVATASVDGTVRLWNGESGQELKVFRGHQGSAEAVDFSPDGKTLITGGQDGRVFFWDVVSGQPQRLLAALPSYVRALRWTPDGKRIIVGGNERTLKIFDADTLAEVATLWTGTSALPMDDFASGGSYQPPTNPWFAVAIAGTALLMVLTLGAAAMLTINPRRCASPAVEAGLNPVQRAPATRREPKRPALSSAWALRSVVIGLVAVGLAMLSCAKRPTGDDHSPVAANGSATCANCHHGPGPAEGKCPVAANAPPTSPVPVTLDVTVGGEPGPQRVFLKRPDGSVEPAANQKWRVAPAPVPIGFLPAADAEPHRRKPWLTAAGVIALVIAAVAIRIWFARRRRQPAAAEAGP